MPDYPELLILRHGETRWNREGRMQGGLDSSLTEKGRAQAKAQNRLIRAAGIGAASCYCSPQGRAMSTARIALQGHGLEIAPDTRLREIGMGRWSGLLRDDIAAGVPHLFQNPKAMAWYGHAPEGETLEELAGRVLDFLTGLTGPSVIVTHGITSRVMRSLILGLPVSNFAALEGGQGVVYRLAPGIYEKRTLQGVTDLGYPTPTGD